MKSSELRAKDQAQLTKELEDLQQLTKTSQLRKVRRDIARVRTLLGEKAVAK